jgi:hypothetical protein
VTVTGWVLIAIGAVATLGAIALLFRVRRFASALPVLALAATSFVVAHIGFLWP